MKKSYLNSLHWQIFQDMKQARLVADGEHKDKSEMKKDRKYAGKLCALKVQNQYMK